MEAFGIWMDTCFPEDPWAQIQMTIDMTGMWRPGDALRGAIKCYAASPEVKRLAEMKVPKPPMPDDPF